MDFGQKLKRYVELKKYIQNGVDEKSIINEYENLKQYFHTTYMQVRLRTGKDPGNQYNFDKWINEEYNQLVSIENLLNEVDDLDNLVEQSDLDLHMQSFDNLGFNNEKVYNWHKSILEILKKENYVMSDFYFTEQNKNNKTLLQHIALKSETYNFLNNVGVLNNGYCPITGEKINNSFNYNIYGRQIFLSKKGLEVCQEIDRKEWNNNKSFLDYDSFQELKKQTKQKTKSQVQLITLIIGIISIIISWNIVSPTGFFSFLGFLIVGVIIFYIIGWIFNFIFDMFY